MGLSFNSGIFDANTHLSLTEHMMQDNCILMGESSLSETDAGTPSGRGSRRRATWRPRCGRR